jgi:methylthioribose-1-phosphate isomerase
VSTFATLRWRDPKLELLDQRVLPDRQVYLAFGDASAVAAAIRDMVVRGAPAIGCAAAYGVALDAQRLQDALPRAFDDGIGHAVSLLRASRPTAVNLAWALERMQKRDAQ